jgi:hypothetical protein
MKAFKWPRPPLMLGFILGSIIELNLQSALSAYGAIAFITRPITVLLLVTILAVFILMRVNREGAAPAVGATLPADPAGQGAIRTHGALGFGGPWRLEHFFSLGILIIVGAAVATAFNFPPRARFLPLLVGGPIIALLLFQLLFMRRSTSGEIMDIGLRSLTVPGAGKTAMAVGGFIALFILLTATIGLPYASIIFAIVFPIAMCRGRMRWTVSALAGTIVAIVALVLLDYYMGVLWPEPVLMGWM